MTTPLLAVDGLCKRFGGLQAVQKVCLRIEPGEIVALIGPNGAGKSTALKAVCGLVPIKTGEIRYMDQPICGMAPDKLVKKGVSLVPEGRHLFPTMTVLENLEMGAFTIPRKEKAIIRERLENVYQLFPVLNKRKLQKAGTLSTGEQQMLALGRALMLKPALLLLDEPSSGLSPNFVEIVFEKLREINVAGTSILLVEQNVSRALEICHRGYVFDVGAIALEGEKEVLINDERIKKIYLGG